MGWIRLFRAVTAAFAALATALNWSELDNIQRVLDPLWVFGIYLPNFLLSDSQLSPEKVGFEPTEACTSSDFKSDAINHLCHLSSYYIIAILTY